MNGFYRSVASVLEIGEVSPDLDFRSVPGWCSLQAFGLLVMMENDWGAPLSIDRFLELKTARDLYREAFLALAAKVFGVRREDVSGATAYGSIPQWDSVNHLKLVMAAEEKFGTSYPMEKIPSMSVLEDFL